MLKSPNSYLFLLFVLMGIFTTTTLTAQENGLILTNSKTLKEDRYKGVKGSPYMFEDWRAGKVISNKADIIDDLELNFNAHTGNFEVRYNQKFIELDPKWYTRVMVEPSEGEAPIVFQKNFHPPLKDKFTRIVYAGKNITVVEDYITKIEELVINNVGRNEEIKKFYSKKNYYLIKGRKPVLIKLKKKNIVALLKDKPTIESFIKKEKIKLNNEKDLVRVFKFYEEG